MKIFSFIFPLMLFFSCGRNEEPPKGYTHVVFGNKPSSFNKSIQVGDPLDGGLMIQLINKDTNEIKTGHWSNIANFIGNNSTVLPNGKYLIFALGFNSGTSDPFTTLYCEPFNNGQSITLAGGVVNLNLMLNKHVNDAKCRHPHFNPSLFHNTGSQTTIKTINLKTCASQPSTSCSGSTVKDIKVEIRKISNLNFNVENNEGFSRCLDDGGNGDYYNNSVGAGPFTLPGGQNFHLRISIYADTSTNCSGTPSRVYDFPQGIGSATNTGTSAPAVGTADAIHYVNTGDERIELQLKDN